MILVVDDYVVTCRALVQLLRLEGRDAEAVTDGRAALDFLRNHCVQLVILDWMMPGMDGLDVLQAIRGDDRFAGLPVVVYSAVAGDAHRQIALGSGADEFIVKGGPFSELLDVVRRYRAVPS